MARQNPNAMADGFDGTGSHCFSTRSLDPDFRNANKTTCNLKSNGAQGFEPNHQDKQRRMIPWILYGVLGYHASCLERLHGSWV